MTQEAGYKTVNQQQTRLYRAVALLLGTQEQRDTLLSECATAEQETGTVPDSLILALDRAEHLLLSLEGEVIDAAYAVITIDRQTRRTNQDESESL